VVTKTFKTKEEAEKWGISRAKLMLKKYNKAIGIRIDIRKRKDWDISVATIYTDDSAKKLRILVPLKKLKK